MTQVTKDRERRGRRRLAVQRRLRSLRQHAKLRELGREQRLVGGHDRLARRQRGAENRLHVRAAGDLDDDVDVGVADQLERIVGERDAGGQRPAILGEIAHGDRRDPEAHAVAIGDRRALARDHLEQAAPDDAAADEADAQLAHRLDADAFEARPRRPRQLAAKRAGAAQHVGEPFLIGEERVVPVHRLELPQRRLRARGLQLAMQLHLQAPTETACRPARRRRSVSAVTLLERGAHRLRIVARSTARSIASLSRRNVLTGNCSANRRP